jgi:hypothetical protein
MNRLKLIILTIFLIIHAFLMACTDHRQKMTPTQALLGHWRTEGGETEYYFSKEQMIMVDKGKRDKPIEYRIEYKSYPNGLIIEIGKPYVNKKITLGSRKVLIFMEDRHSLIEDNQFTTVIDGKFQWASWGTELWRYVDQKQNP